MLINLGGSSSTPSQGMQSEDCSPANKSKQSSQKPPSLSRSPPFSACALGLLLQNLQCSSICPKLVSSIPETNAARIQLETNEWVRGSALLVSGSCQETIICFPRILCGCLPSASSPIISEAHLLGRQDMAQSISTTTFLARCFPLFAFLKSGIPNCTAVRSSPRYQSPPDPKLQHQTAAV